MAVGDTILIKDISINGNDELKNASNLSETLKDNTINAFGIDASSRTIWVNGQPYGNAYVNIKDDNAVEAPIGAEIFNDFEHNIASGEYSHAEGFMTETHGKYSHTEGSYNDARGENSILQGHCLFDYELDKSNNPTIWLQLYDEDTSKITGTASSNNIGCGFIEITGGPLKIKEQRGDQYFYGTYYQVEGLFYIKAADGVWRQSLKLYDANNPQTNFKYYIKSDDFHKIKDTWKQYSVSNPINLTDPFYIYTINTVNYDFPYVTQIGVHVKGCDWYTGDITNTRYVEYKKRILHVHNSHNSNDSINLLNRFEKDRVNRKPKLSICNNLTVIGQYNKPKEYDIFEVGCGIGGLDNNGKKNAISVDTGGFTTIPKLKSEYAYISNLESSKVNVPSHINGQVLLSNNTLEDEFKELPKYDNSDEEYSCKSIICRDGILIGYTQNRCMTLTIDKTTGEVKLINKIINSKGEKQTNQATFNWSILHS